MEGAIVVTACQRKAVATRGRRQELARSGRGRKPRGQIVASARG